MGGQGGQRVPQNTYSTLRQLCKLAYRVVRSAGIGTSCSGPREQRQEEPNTRRSAQPHDEYESPGTRSCTLGLILHRYVDHRFSPCTSRAPSQYSSLGHMRTCSLIRGHSSRGRGQGFESPLDSTAQAASPQAGMHNVSTPRTEGSA